MATYLHQLGHTFNLSSDKCCMPHVMQERCMLAAAVSMPLFSAAHSLTGRDSGV